MGLVTPEQQQSLLTGITLDDGPAKVEKLVDGGGEGSNHWYHVVLSEGRNREVRRLFEALGLTVSRLIRTRYGPVAMPSRVKRGQVLELSPEEVGAVLTAAGMRSTGPSPQRQGQGHDHRVTARGRAGPTSGRPRPARSGAGRTASRARSARRSSGRSDAAPESEGIEPGNSVHGLPTHGNTPVGKFFSRVTANRTGGRRARAARVAVREARDRAVVHSGRKGVRNMESRGMPSRAAHTARPRRT
jgi:23S rRNA pseudouridine2605 synthase